MISGKYWIVSISSGRYRTLSNPWMIKGISARLQKKKKRRSPYSHVAEGTRRNAKTIAVIRATIRTQLVHSQPLITFCISPYSILMAGFFQLNSTAMLRGSSTPPVIHAPRPAFFPHSASLFMLYPHALMTDRELSDSYRTGTWSRNGPHPRCQQINLSHSFAGITFD